MLTKLVDVKVPGDFLLLEFSIFFGDAVAQRLKCLILVKQAWRQRQRQALAEEASLTSTVEVVVMKGTLGDADVRIMLVVA